MTFFLGRDKAKKKSLMFIVNEPGFFISHRMPIALRAMDDGYEVHLASAVSGSVKEIESKGIIFHCIPFSRSGKNLFHEFFCLFAIYRLLLKVNPTIVHLVTIKPVLYGGIAARFIKRQSVVAAISGLGHVFSGKETFLKALIKKVYKVALNNRWQKVVFQNACDMDVLHSINACSMDNSVLIRGSGVDLTKIKFESEPGSEPITFIFAARLLKQKGINEFIEAAKKIGYPEKTRFLVAGTPDPGNPESIEPENLELWRNEGIVEVLGHVGDIPQLFSKCHVVVLPSYYGEGLPKVLIEAAAAGRAVITTDHPGCRDAIEENVTGLLVPIRDTFALVKAMEKLINDSKYRQSLGREGRRLAEKEFSIEKVVDEHLKIYAELRCLGVSSG